MPSVSPTTRLPEGPDWEPLDLPPDPRPEPEGEPLPKPPDMRRQLGLVSAAAVLLVAGIIAAGLHFSATGISPDETQPDQAAAAGQPEPDKTDPQQERCQADFQRLLVEANQALAERRYADAIKAYTAARDLVPENVEAAKGLAAAREGQANQARGQQEDEKRKAEFARLLAEAKTALVEKKPAQAVQALESALQLMPGEPGALAMLADARKALGEDMDEQRKLAEYKKFMAAGQAALAAQRYTDAVREYTAALNILPGDKDALDGRRLAEQRLVEQQLEGKKRDTFVRAMNHGVAAFKGGRYDDAVKAFEAAAQLYPNDKEAQNALAQAKQALSKAQAAFKTLMTQADVALRTQRFTDAHRLLREALQLFPNDPTALQSLKALERYLNDVQAAQAAYQQYMAQAAAAMQAQLYEEALRQYAQALQWVPGDPRALQAQRDAQARWEYDQRNRPLYTRAMQAADAAMQQGRFTDAIRLYQEALTLYPQDTFANNGLRKGRYSLFISQGEALMRARRYADAANEFARALGEFPGDPTASKLLAQAKASIRR